LAREKVVTDAFPSLPSRYRVIRPLGKGSQKSVFLAHDESLDRPVAISVIDGRDVPTAAQDGLYEARALARISDHPDIISVFDIAEGPGVFYIISQYAAGGDLRRLLATHDAGGLPIEQSLHVGLQVARALAFAHERGVVHQDVKPGNVFLDERGNALLGDLGLALILGRPKVSADEEIAGTPGYMAPELSQGAKPAAASDLYSLGCLLYELATGRRPFSSFAEQVSGKRLVPPIELVPSIPITLNDLIVDLLQANPARRPASGREVAAALEGILTAGLVVPPATAARRERIRTVTRSMPRTVGRQAELHWIHGALADLRANRSGVLLIEGGPGIGKTQLVDELRALAAREGMNALIGRGREDAALPYMPMVEALLPMASGCQMLPPADGEALRRFLLLSAADRAPVEADQDPTPHTEAAQHRLAASMWSVLVELSRRRPLIFVLDDFQWVDSASLDLFEFFAAAMQCGLHAEEARILLVACYRTGSSGLAFDRAIAKLRAGAAQRLHIEPVDATSVTEIMKDAGIVRPSAQLTEIVFEASGGNPLFVRELVRHLQHEDALAQQHGFTVAKPSGYGLVLPKSVTAAIEGHIRSVSEACQRLLTSAAFLRPWFTLPVLAALEQRGDDEILVLLEEAAERDLVVDQGHAFRFAHPLIRHAFQQRLGPTRRQRMHLKLAEYFESSFPESVAEIAHHLLLAGAGAERPKTIEYCRRAADEAESKFAWTEASRFLEAVVALGDTSLSKTERAEIHRRAAATYYYRSDVGPCMHHFAQAIRWFKEAGDAPGLARSVAMKYSAVSIHGAVGIGELANVAELQECLALLGSDHPALRAQLKGALSEVYWTGRFATEADTQAREALQLAQDAGDHRVCAQMYSRVSMTQGQRLALRQAVDSLELGMAEARLADDSLLLDRCAQRIPPLLLMAGRLDEVQAAIDRTRDLHRSDALIAAMSTTLLATIRGDFIAAEASASRALRLMAYSRLVWAATAVLTCLAYSRALKGDCDGANEAITKLLEPDLIFDRPRPASFEVYRALIEIYAAEPPDPRAAVWLRAISKAAVPDYFAVLQACMQVEIAHALGMGDLPESVNHVLEAVKGTDLLFTPGWPFFVPRLHGLAAIVRGRRGEGEDLLRAAIATATRLGADAELYRALTDLGALLIASSSRSDRQSGQELLARAHRLSGGRFSPSFTKSQATPRLAQS
jgi:hypothetical protein